ncbi:MAG: N-acetylmuramoyl-L-alanine amidase [bacterium]|nr:N-acetylmuramoyl-L-alanine amidase [bacterium]
MRYCKNISRIEFQLFACLLLLWMAVPTLARVTDARTHQDQIVVIYPKPEQTVSAVDSTFILGNVPLIEGKLPAKLRINDQLVPCHRNGGFLAFVPVVPGKFEFNITATYNLEAGSREIRLGLPVYIPLAAKTIEPDSLVILGDYLRPAGDLSLVSGEQIRVGFRGTTGCSAWFSIPGVVDSVPMAETAPRTQAYWGQSVFGAGNVPDSVKLGGVYTGFFTVPDSISVEDAYVQYHLGLPDRGALLLKLLSGELAESDPLVKLLFLSESAQAREISGYRVSMNSAEFPLTVRFTDSVQTIRHGPRRGYFSIFQPEGVVALAIGDEDNWYKLKLSSTQFAYAAKGAVEVLADGILPPKSLLRSLRTKSDSNSVTISFPLAGKHPFRIREESRRRLVVELFGVTTDTDWIRYDFNDSLIDLAVWSQPEPGIYRLTIDFNVDLWGYDSYYIGNNFNVRINYPPSKLNSLKGKRIVVDPGHSSDLGSVGPTGLTEAEANLMIALKLRERLESKGATVVMTREDDSDVPLYDRPSISKRVDADLFVSIHNNALPDGVNPFTNNGVSAYYYHPHSIDLARSIHKEMIPATGLKDHGLFHGNLAVNRPTQYPAVLIECAFMIIPEQEARLKTEKFQKKIAEAISKGIENFLKEFGDD